MDTLRDFQRAPQILKHCTMAVYNKGHVTGGTDQERFSNAWNIARAHLTRYGYLRPGSETSEVKFIRLTVKGMARNLKHFLEGGAGKGFDGKANLLLQVEPEKIEQGGVPPSQIAATPQYRQSQGVVPVLTSIPKPGTKRSAKMSRTAKRGPKVKQAKRPKIGKARRR